MRIAVSQIAWQPQQQAQALSVLRQLGYTGLEIAPTIVAGAHPYENPQAAAEFAAQMRREHGLSICSVQSIWYGQAGSIFGQERDALLEYTKGAVCFAEAAGAQNLVFGCPKNRVLPEGATPKDADGFFKELGDYAHKHGAVLALEANPEIYGTNFVNTTKEAFETAKRVASPGFKVNLDFGTMVENKEDISVLEGAAEWINHVHISEPYLAMIEQRQEHKDLAQFLAKEGYTGWVSVEMKDHGLENLKKAAEYVAGVFGDA